MSMSGAAVTSMPPQWMREVAREAIDPGAELQPALPVAQADRRAAAGLRRRLGLDAGDRRVARRPATTHRRTSTAARWIPVVRPSQRLSVRRAAAARPGHSPDRSAGRRPAPAARAGRAPPRSRSPSPLAARRRSPACPRDPPSSSGRAAAPDRRPRRQLVREYCPTAAPDGADRRCRLRLLGGLLGGVFIVPEPGERLAVRSGPPAPAAGARAAPSRRAGSACSAGPSRRPGQAPRRPRPPRLDGRVPLPSVGRTRRTRRRPRGRAGP